MKKLILCVVVLSVMNVTDLFAQERTMMPPPPPKPEAHFQHLKVMLDLTDEQFASIKELGARHDQEMKSLHEEAKKQMEKTAEKVKALMKEEQEAIKKVLTEEQQEKYNEMLSMRKERRQHKSHQHREFK